MNGDYLYAAKARSTSQWTMCEFLCWLGRGNGFKSCEFHHYIMTETDTS